MLLHPQPPVQCSSTFLRIHCPLLHNSPAICTPGGNIRKRGRGLRRRTPERNGSDTSGFAAPGPCTAEKKSGAAAAHRAAAERAEAGNPGTALRRQGDERTWREKGENMEGGKERRGGQRRSSAGVPARPVLTLGCFLAWVTIRRNMAAAGSRPLSLPGSAARPPRPAAEAQCHRGPRAAGARRRSPDVAAPPFACSQPAAAGPAAPPRALSPPRAPRLSAAPGPPGSAVPGGCRHLPGHPADHPPPLGSARGASGACACEGESSAVPLMCDLFHEKLSEE